MDNKEKIRNTFAELVHQGEMCWGCLVSSPNEADEAKALGASWLVASHVGMLSKECPSSVIGLMPFADANEIVLKMGKSLAKAAGDIPLLAGVLATDQFRIMDNFIDRLKRAGYVGIQNFPSIGILSGRMRTLLESSEMGYDCEVRLIRKAAEKEMFCSAVVFEQEDANAMIEAGADMLVAHLPLTDSGDVQEWGPANCKFLTQLHNEKMVRANAILTAGFVSDSVKMSKGIYPSNDYLAQYESVGYLRRPLAAEKS